MDPHNLDAGCGEQAGGAGGASIAFFRRGRPSQGLLERPADKPLARVAHEDRHAQIEECASMGQKSEIVGVRLAKPDAGIKADAIERNAGG